MMMHISKKKEKKREKQPFSAGTNETDSNMGLRVINKLIKKESMEQL